MTGARATPAVPFLDLRAAYDELQPEIDAAVSRVSRSGWYLLGDELRAFESAWASYCSARHAIGVANGLDALILGLRALGIGAGDEVIVPSNTYIATWLAVTHVGATVVPVEPVETTFNLDPGNVARAITPRTRAVIPVHLYGQPADMLAIVELARAAGIAVLDDAAQAHGARVGGHPVGALADLTAWSFYPGKNLGAYGDGGAVTTNDDMLADRIRILRNYGSRVKYVNEVVGVNSRLDEIQAAILHAKLTHLNDWNQRRARQAARYTEALEGLPLLRPSVAEWAEPVWHLYVVRVRNRDVVQQRLASAGIETLIHYPIPPHRQSAYAALGWRDGQFPISERIHSEVLSLPIGPH